MFAPTCILPIFPSEGTHVPAVTQIIWNWNSVTDATGYKWNTINDYSSSTDMVAVTTKTETGLTCHTAYNRYVWAYNSCGNSTPVTLNQTTSACGGVVRGMGILDYCKSGKHSINILIELNIL